MYAWTLRPAPPASEGAPSPLLTHLAGVFAPRIAGLWPQPHRPFLEAEAARRHLVCLALAHHEGPLDTSAAEAALAWPLRRAVKVLAPGAPAGLARALARLGEVAWIAEDYRQLVTVLGAPKTGPMLTHAETISADRVRVLATMPEALHAAGLGHASMNETQVRVLRDAHRALVGRDGEAAAARAVRGWGAGTSTRDIFGRAKSSLRRALSPPPFDGVTRLRPIRTLTELDEAGGRYKNCLAHLGYAGEPDYAFYEWLGEPGVVIQLDRDRLYGWSLREALAAKNEPPPLETQVEIIKVLRAEGVHVGYTAEDLEQALARASGDRTPPHTVDEAIGWRFGRWP